MISMGRLTATLPCTDCPAPVHLRIPVECQLNGAGTVDVEIDGYALRLAVHAHFKQHEIEE